MTELFELCKKHASFEQSDFIKAEYLASSYDQINNRFGNKKKQTPLMYLLEENTKNDELIKILAASPELNYACVDANERNMIHYLCLHDLRYIHFCDAIELTGFLFSTDKSAWNQIRDNPKAIKWLNTTNPLEQIIHRLINVSTCTKDQLSAYYRYLNDFLQNPLINQKDKSKSFQSMLLSKIEKLCLLIENAFQNNAQVSVNYFLNFIQENGLQESIHQTKSWLMKSLHPFDDHIVMFKKVIDCFGWYYFSPQDSTQFNIVHIAARHNHIKALQYIYQNFDFSYFFRSDRYNRYPVHFVKNSNILLCFKNPESNMFNNEDLNKTSPEQGESEESKDESHDIDDLYDNQFEEDNLSTHESENGSAFSEINSQDEENDSNEICIPDRELIASSFQECDQHGNSLLHYLLSDPDSPINQDKDTHYWKKLRFLFSDHKLDLTQPNQKGLTPFDLALHFNRLIDIEDLLELLADSFSQDQLMSMIKSATNMGCIHLVEQLQALCSKQNEIPQESLKLLNLSLSHQDFINNITKISLSIQKNDIDIHIMQNAVSLLHKKFKEKKFNCTVLHLDEMDEWLKWIHQNISQNKYPSHCNLYYLITDNIHWICGQITLEDSQVKKILIIDSLIDHIPTNEVYENFSIFFEEATIYISADKVQGDDEFCSIYSYDCIQRLQKLHLYLPESYKNIYDFLDAHPKDQKSLTRRTITLRSQDKFIAWSHSIDKNQYEHYRKQKGCTFEESIAKNIDLDGKNRTIEKKAIKIRMGNIGLFIGNPQKDTQTSLKKNENKVSHKFF